MICSRAFGMFYARYIGNRMRTWMYMGNQLLYKHHFKE